MRTHNIPFSIQNKKNTLNLSQLWDFFKGPKNEFETAVVNFEPLNFYCRLKIDSFSEKRYFRHSTIYFKGYILRKCCTIYIDTVFDVRFYLTSNVITIVVWKVLSLVLFRPEIKSWKNSLDLQTSFV